MLLLLIFTVISSCQGFFLADHLPLRAGMMIAIRFYLSVATTIAILPQSFIIMVVVIVIAAALLPLFSEANRWPITFTTQLSIPIASII